jgi:Na+:H+ antiporter, NhaC family
MSASSTRQAPALLLALIPIVFLIGALSINVIWAFGDEGISGSNQMILMLSAAVAGITGYVAGIRWKTMLAGIEQSIKSTVPAILILLLIGGLAGTWMLSGVVPAMIYYGLQVLHPSVFLLATCFICAMVSLATGSSWSTVATVGIALLGIGKTLGFSEPMIAGAIISGAYFGDKISPLSDTTNLAPAMAGTDLFTHIRYMLYTTTPSFVITLVLFAILGLNHNTTGEIIQSEAVMQQVKDVFFIHPVLFLVPALVIWLIIRRVPAIPALFAGMLAGGLFALLFQGDTIRSLSESGSSYALQAYKAIMNAITVPVSYPTEDPMLADLFSSKGMQGMLGTIWLVLAAMSFGGVMEACGFLKALADSLMRLARSTASLVTTTATTCIAVNILASDQYLAIVIPGKMYENLYRETGLKPENLSRTLEDAGTVTSPLVPWNTCGAYHAGVLGVATGAYLPYCFFNLLSPVMTILFAVFNIKIRKYSHQELQEIRGVKEFS